MFFLSIEATSKYQQLKTQMLISLNDDEFKKTETVWKGNGFFNEQWNDLAIAKPNFPENTMVYVNQGSISTVNGGHAIYLEFVIIGQLMPIANPDPKLDLEKHEFKDHDALLFIPVYNTVTGMYSGLTKKLAHITLRGTSMKDFIHMVTVRKKVLYCIV